MFAMIGQLFSTLWSWIVTPFGYIMQWCYQLFHDGLGWPVPYLFAMLLFAIVMRVLQFPLSINQQKQTARTSALTPMMDRIRKTYAKDPNRQNEEIAKLQQDMGVSMTSGCLPMLIQFPIMFILIEVIYKPLTYMLRIPAELLMKLNEIAVGTGVAANDRMIQNHIINLVKTQPNLFTGLQAQYPEQMNIIETLDMNIGSISLLDTPSIQQPSLLWLLPVFMIVTMLIQSLLSMKNMPNTGQPGTGKGMMIVMSVMFGFFAFSYPAGFSLYWGLTNILMIGQTALLRRFVDTEAIKQQVLDDYEAKKKKNKAEKQVKIKDETTGEVVEKKISPSELARLRLQKAREMDSERYGEGDKNSGAGEYTGRKEEPKEKKKK